MTVNLVAKFVQNQFSRYAISIESIKVYFCFDEVHSERIWVIIIVKVTNIYNYIYINTEF